jgi:hypothetical protein
MITVQPRGPGLRCALPAPGDMACVTPKSGNRHTAHHHQHETSAPESARQNRYTNPLHTASAERRHLFITDAVMNGLPPHIAQIIAGHQDINTTISYKAAYPEEAIQAHRAFLARRRALRPTSEYRVPTDEEWQEFLGHFERRKLATGTCGRAFGTPCIHEHSCLRCSMHWPSPAQRHRIAEIRDNLIARIAEAEREGWPGEIEGLKISLAGANDNLAQIDRRTQPATPVNLGMPAPTTPATTAHPHHPPPGQLPRQDPAS